MATRLKTVEFAHPVTLAAVNNTLTTATQITVYLPETGTKTFRSVVATLSAVNTATATGNITSRLLQCRLGAAAYTANTNANAITTSAEDIVLFHAVDLTSHFTTNWTGTSMTFDSQFTLNGAASGSAWTNVCVTLTVTYEYDDTSTTQIKTVRIPLNAPVGAMATTKPGTATATIPALDTELPEASKIYRSTHVVVQGNINRAAATDASLNLQLDATALHTSGVFEGLSNTDYWYRYVWDCSAVLTPATSQGFYIYATGGTYFNHAQIWLVVTYEFDASAANDVFVSLMLPQDMASPMGGTTTADYQRAIRSLSIQEPGTITTKQIAFFPFWTQVGAISTLNFRVGTGSFVAYTDVAATTAGSNGAMVRNDAAFTLARGRNTLTFDAYRSDTTDYGQNLSGFWIINYTAGKPTQGYGAANHSVRWHLVAPFTGASFMLATIAATAPNIPETEYYLTSLGTELEFYCGGTVAPSGVAISVERLAAEGGVAWENVQSDLIATDPEVGLITSYSQIRSLFGHYPGSEEGELALETARRWRVLIGSTTTQTAWYKFGLLFSYHTITKQVAGTVSGYAGTGVGIPVTVHRTLDGEKIASTTTTTGGAFTATVYYDTDTYYVVAREDATHVGRSDDGSP